MIPSFDSNGNLPSGHIEPNIQEFEDRFVREFTASITREGIFNSYILYCRRILSLAVGIKQWVDGSYITSKINPNDVDLVTHFDATKVNEQTSMELDELLDNPTVKKQYQCDVYAIFVFPQNSPDKYEFYQEQINYWSDWFGHDRQRNPKGIVEFSLDENFLIKEE